MAKEQRDTISSKDLAFILRIYNGLTPAGREALIAALKAQEPGQEAAQCRS